MRGLGERPWAILIACLVVGGASAAVPAQGTKPAFEVASVKQNIAGLSPVGHLTVQPGGRLLATNQTARSLIQFAFSVSEPQLLDAPEWTRNLRFDVNAKSASADASVADLRRMLQTLLETRFRLVLMAEQREMNVQAIVRNRDDGKLGGRLVEVSSQAECAAGLASLPKVERPAGAVAAMVWQCGSPDQILPEMVYKQLREIAVDRTELTGIWLASIVFKPEGVSNPSNSAMDDNVPTFSTALQEQLGLRLTRVRSTIPILSVKSIEMPTDD